MSKQLNNSNETFNVSVTAAQFALLELLRHPDAPDYAESLKEVHELGTYYVNSKDLVNLSASRQVHWLYDAVYAIAIEEFNQPKTA